MQVQTQKNGKVYENRSEILNKALNIAKQVHEIAWWTMKQSVPEVDYFEMAPFYVEWLRSEIRRLWNIDILKEEAEYLWQKAILGF